MTNFFIYNIVNTYTTECPLSKLLNVGPDDSPKHVEPFNEKIKTIHKNLCISLVYIHIAILCTVRTASKSLNVLTHFRDCSSEDVAFGGHNPPLTFKAVPYSWKCQGGGRIDF